MTVIKPNSIAGIVSVTAQGDVINFYKSDGTLAGLEIGGARINASGVSTFSSLQTTNLNVSGVGTIATLTVTGNASIGGTVTYMDVTNVDSVGIITAQQGIQVLANGINVTGVSTVAAGSAAAPSITPTGDSNTGIFFPSADTIAFSEGGVEAARFDSSGRLLVGTSSDLSGGDADARLQVNGDAGAQVLLSRQDFGALTADTLIGEVVFRSQASGVSETSALIKCEADATQGSGDKPGRLVFSTTADGASSPTERARIDSSGRLLVGTSSSRNVGSSVGSRLQIEHQSSDGVHGLSVVDTTDSAQIAFGTNNSGTVCSSGKLLARINFCGNDGTNGLLNNSAWIEAYADGTWGNNDVPGRLVFSTTADGASSPTERMRITSAGLVGIGTAGPSELLHVNGNALVEDRLLLQRLQSSDNLSVLTFADTLTGSKSNNLSFGNPGGFDLLFHTAGVEKARIDLSGRLLVGTSSARTASIGGNNQVVFEAPATYFNTIFATNQNGADGSFLCFVKSRGTTAGSHTVVNNGDNLGIISFEGADGTQARSAAQIIAQVDGTPGSADMPGRLVFSTTADGASSPTERVRITNSGYFKASTLGGVYIGATTGHHEFVSNTNGQYTLHVQSNAETSNQYGLQIRTTSDQNDSTRLFLNCVGDTTQRAAFRTNGGLANYSANNANLSDRNAKKDISPAADTWDCIKEWEIVNYRYKDQPDDADLNLGVIAQQVAESCPEVITVFQEAKEATETEPAQEKQLGVKEQQMYWMAIKALQEAQVRIETLEAEVAALKAQ